MATEKRVLQAVAAYHQEKIPLCSIKSLDDITLHDQSVLLSLRFAQQPFTADDLVQEFDQTGTLAVPGVKKPRHYPHLPFLLFYNSSPQTLAHALQGYDKRKVLGVDNMFFAAHTHVDFVQFPNGEGEYFHRAAGEISANTSIFTVGFGDVYTQEVMLRTASEEALVALYTLHRKKGDVPDFDFRAFIPAAFVAHELSELDLLQQGASRSDQTEVDADVLAREFLLSKGYSAEQFETFHYVRAGKNQDNTSSEYVNSIKSFF